MKFRPSYIKLESFKRTVFFMLIALITISFFSKNVISNYSDDQAELIELIENGEESETETEREEVDDYTSAIVHVILQTKVMSHYAEDVEIIWNTRYSEVLTPPPDIV